ncbi:hypothetical protein L3V77_18565 [Vibrio sp. DW001]|uniref:rhodanese-like domain-containing protein n=1 Tax=Vibrio sp. DW001 TaxID=2912315 RepID=UPI0023AF8C93|nr:rhodanese-like domain-containing protein [Vibrio sp. DW001]WED29429.1 hypothetical protein L3V77_18565 [Vibrio sp. DW001]
MNAIEFFESKIKCTVSPMDYLNELNRDKDTVVLVDVRNAPAHIKKDKIKGAIEIAQSDLADNLDKISKDKRVVVYCWDTFCNLGAKAAITLLNNGYDVRELSGGIAAWKSVRLEIEDL